VGIAIGLVVQGLGVLDEGKGGHCFKLIGYDN